MEIEARELIDETKHLKKKSNELLSKRESIDKPPQIHSVAEMRHSINLGNRMAAVVEDERLP